MRFSWVSGTRVFGGHRESLVFEPLFLVVARNAGQMLPTRNGACSPYPTVQPTPHSEACEQLCLLCGELLVREYSRVAKRCKLLELLYDIELRLQHWLGRRLRGSGSCRKAISDDA